MRGIFVAPLLRILPVGLLALSLQRVVFANHPIHDVRLQLLHCFDGLGPAACFADDLHARLG